MRKVKKIMLMRLFFSQLNVCGRKHLATYGRREIACANFSSPLRDKPRRNEESVKNNADAIIFHTTKCVAGNTFSYNRRAESEIQLAFLRQQVPAEMRNRMKKLSKLAESKDLVLYLSKNDFKTKYAGSYMGIIWAFIQPLVTIVLYWFVFQVGLRSGDIGDTPFILWLMAGLIPWFFFQEALVNATNCFAEYSYLVKKVVFNINILPVVKVVSSLFVHIFFMGLLIVAYILMGYFPGIIVIQLVYYSFCMIVLVLSISYFTSAISVFFKDTTQIINVFMQVGTWLTPILWNFYAPEFQEALGKLGIIFKLNPMFYIVDGCRGTMIEKRLFFEKPMLTLYFWLFVLVMSLISKFVYTRLKPHFADSL